MRLPDCQILLQFEHSLIILVNIHITDSTEIQRLLMLRIMQQILLKIMNSSLQIVSLMIVLLRRNQQPGMIIRCLNFTQASIY